MTAFLIKVLSSAVVIGIVTEVARRSVTYGGVIAALPLVSLLSLIWLVQQGQSKTEVTMFVKSVLYGLPATFFLVLILYILLNQGVSIFISVLLAGGCWWIFWTIQQQVGLFIGRL
ncbi:DUF3147 family protein [Exiguobacterium sp. s127]|uniref:DUF3147 family protein n=1 Tax=Exiguobacterium sp. s127 TaxID=2751210 RepID=UPI001BEB0D91|nr:DUF3147 family protein [Exiguobacterium sp. s127]